MAGDWIKVRHDLFDDPDVLQMSDILNIEVPTVVGQLIMFWGWMDRHTVDGKQINLSESMIDKKLGMPNFASSLRRVGWLSGDDGSLELPQYDRHNGNTAKARALESEAKRLRRSVGQPSDKKDTKSPTREEKRREENKENKQKKNFDFEIPDWIPFDEFNQWMKKRKTLKATNSENAWKLLLPNIEEIKKAGYDLKTVFILAHDQGWKGLKLDWVSKHICGTSQHVDPFYLAVNKAKELKLDPFRGAAGNPPENKEQFIERVSNAA